MNKLIKKIALTGLLVLIPLMGCQVILASDKSSTGQLVAISVSDKSGMTVKGVVVDEKQQPVQGVVVNDGYHFTVTDADGFYYLPSDLGRSKFVSVTLPPDYKVPVTQGIATGYYQALTDGKEVNRCDFVLQRRTEPLSAFDYIAIADPQVKNYTQLDRFRKESLPDLKATIDASQGREVYAMTLGDNVWDAMDLFPPYKAALGSLGIAMFSTIGNHDFDLAYAMLVNTDSRKPYAEKEYEETFGPMTYAVNIGKIHIVSLNDIDYVGGKKYTERLTQDQLDWLRNDLSYVKPGTVIFLNMHAPVLNRTANGSGNIKNAAELISLLKDYKVHIFTGHTHFFENEEIAPALYEHNIGTACGAWWAGEVNRCGAPNGYLVVHVEGDDVKWRYKTTGHDFSYQFRVYKPGEFVTQSGYLVANVWDWDAAWKVRWYANGVLQGDMEQFADEDQAYMDMKEGKASGYQTMHLFRVQPGKDVKKITVEVVNRFGESFKQDVVL